MQSPYWVSAELEDVIFIIKKSYQIIYNLFQGTLGT